MNCDMCRYWNRVGARIGECRRNPPRSKPRDLDHGDELAWVLTKHTDWCGECFTDTGESLREAEKGSMRSENQDSDLLKNQLLTERDTAMYLGVSRSFLAQARMNGTVRKRTPGPPYIRLGRTIRYKQCDLEEWIDQHGYRG